MVKDLAGQMMLYKDANYTEPYMSPPTLTLDDDLYIQVSFDIANLTFYDLSVFHVVTRIFSFLD